MEQKSPWVFRLCAGSADYAAAMVGFLQGHGAPKTMATVYENTNFGQSQAAAMHAAAARSGIAIVDEEAYNAGSPSYSPMLQRVKEKRPEVLYFRLLPARRDDADATVTGGRSQCPDFAAAGTGFSAAEFPTDDKGAGKDAEYTIAASQWVPEAGCRGPGSSTRNSWPGTDRTRPTTRCRRTRR